MHNQISMWWKIYFWLNVLLIVAGLISYGTFPRWSVRDFFDITLCILGVVGLFAYVYKKQLLTPSFWVWYFWISVGVVLIDIGHLYSGLYTLPPYLFAPEVTAQKAWYIPALLLFLPQYYAIYQLAYPTKPSQVARSTKKRKK